MSPSGSVGLEFSREEEWVVHVAVHAAIRKTVEQGDGIGEQGDDGPPERRIARKIEADDRFDVDELSVLRDALVTYLGDAPLRDRAPGRAALRTVNQALGISPADA